MPSWRAAAGFATLATIVGAATMTDSPTRSVTELLAAWRAGDAAAPDALATLVYDQLRAMAARRLAGSVQRPLQTTELVHETFARLLAQPLSAVDRSHFFRTAAMALRQALVDAIRREAAGKRGGEAIHVSLEHAADAALADATPWLDIEAALQALEREDARKCRVVEMALLLGLEQAEIATLLDVSVPTVERDLRFARAWLRDRLEA